MPLRALLRLLILLVTLAGLTGLTLQNLTPQITLVFLGTSLTPMPLGYLLLGAIAAGVVTGLLLLSLLRLASYLTWREFQSLEAASSFPNIGATRQSASSAGTEKPNSQQFVQDQQLDSQPQTRTGQQTGSTYSYTYNYQKSPDSEAAPQSVYDADYRVIRPPNQEVYQANANRVDEQNVYDFDPDELDFDFDVAESDTPEPPRRRKPR